MARVQVLGELALLGTQSHRALPSPPLLPVKSPSDRCYWTQLLSQPGIFSIQGYSLLTPQTDLNAKLIWVGLGEVSAGMCLRFPGLF